MERGNQMVHVWSCLLPCIPGEATSSTPWPQPPLRRAPTRVWSTSAGESAPVKGKTAQNSVSVFTRQPVWKWMCVCASEQQLWWSESSQNFPESARARERKASSSRDEILGSLEAQGTAGALLPPSALIPSSFPLTFRTPSLPTLLPCVSVSM